MRARKIVFFLILLLSCHAVFAQAESSFITIKTKDGKYLVSGILWSEDVKNEILKKITGSLGPNLESSVTVSEYILEFDKGWEEEFDKTLRGFSKKPSGMLSFSSTPRVLDRRMPDDIMAAEISLMDGPGPVTLNDLKRGRVIVLLLESWCGPCIGQAQYLNDLYPSLKEKGIEVFGLSVQISPAEKAEFRDFVHHRQGFGFKFGWIDLKTFKALFEVSKSLVIPQVFLISGGRLQGVFAGGGYFVNARIKRAIDHFWIYGSHK
jgi:thiol-disulfide isomerase/thioredoxin